MPEVDPSFLERSCVGLNVAVFREWLCHACIDGILPSIHLCCLLCCECQNPEALTPYLTPPPVSSCPCLPDEQSLMPGASVLQMSPIIMLLQMSKAGLLSRCVFRVCCMLLGGYIMFCSCHSSLCISQCNQMH